MVSPGAPGGVRDPCPITWVPINIHSAATRPVSIRAGFFIDSSSTGILKVLEGLGKGKEMGIPVNEDCGYLEKFAQGCAASPVAER
tara:strand:+ start:302 stop:559 length:258 start_codon:yes stop_codon:yes gene_type:complete